MDTNYKLTGQHIKSDLSSRKTRSADRQKTHKKFAKQLGKS